MDEQVEVKDYVNMDPNEAFDDNDHSASWANVLQQHRDAGYTDSQIVNKFDNSRWVNGAKYNEWRSKVKAQDLQRNADIDQSIAERELGQVPYASSKEIDSLNAGYNTLQKDEGDGYKESEEDFKDRRKHELRDKYSTDNATFRKMAQDEGIELAAKGSMMNIQEAYLNGHINKGERNYLILDAIQTAMSNAGNALMNIAAAYTGGSGNNPTNQKAMWQDRMKGVNEAQTTAMQRNVQDSEAEAKKRQEAANATNTELQNRKMEYQLLPAEAMYEIAQDENNPGWLRGLAMSMTADFAGNDQDLKDTIVTALANSKNEISEAAAKEGISEIEYLTRELGKLGAGFTSGVVGSLFESVKGLKDDALGAAQDKVNDLVYGDKKEANVDFVTPEQAQRVSKALSAANLGIIDEDTMNTIIRDFKNKHPGRGVNLNEIAVNIAIYKAKTMGAKISNDVATDFEIKARNASDEELDKIIAKIGKKVPKPKYN